MTPEAQNALLKVLEEPPLHTIIILSAATKEAFLPTVLSRCKIIAIQEEVRKLADDTKKEIAGFITQLATFGTADALMIAERVGKNKDQALEWLQNAIIYLHEKLKEDAMLASILQEFHATHKVLKSTNTNPRLALENMFLSLTTAKK